MNTLSLKEFSIPGLINSSLGLTCGTRVLAASLHPQRDGRGALPALPASLLPPCLDGTGKGPKKHEEKTNHPPISRAGGSWRDGQSWAHKIFGIPAQLPGSRHGEGGGELSLPREGAENRSGEELPELFRGRQPRAICCVSVRGERAAAFMIIIACFIFLLLFFLKRPFSGSSSARREEVGCLQHRGWVRRAWRTTRLCRGTDGAGGEQTLLRRRSKRTK